MKPRSVPYFRVYTGEDEVTRFEDLAEQAESVDFAPPAPPVHVTRPHEASGIFFISFAAGWTDLAHPSPARQFCIMLSGDGIVTAGSDERRVGAGMTWLLEDTSGVGHGFTALTDCIVAVVRL